MTERSEGVQTVEKALIVLTNFTYEHSLWGITDLSNKLGMPKSVIHRILISLQRFGFVEKDLQTEKYRLGIKLFELGNVAAGHMDLRKYALLVMQELTRVSGESTLLTIKDGHYAVCIEFVEGSQSMPLKTSSGIRLPLHCGATKKIHLAFQSETFIKQYLATETLTRISDNTLMAPDAILQELARIRREGVSITANEVDRGATVIAAAIFGHNGDMIAGLGLGGPLFRFPEGRVREYTSLVKEAALKISLKMGYSFQAGQ